VHAANVQDRAGAKLLLDPLQAQKNTSFPRLRLVWADKGYTGPLDDWMQEDLGCRLEVVSYPTKPSVEEDFWQDVKQRCQAGVTGPELYVGLSLKRANNGSMPVVPRRWVVERSFAWLGRNRRLSKDYEMLPCSSEAFVYLAMIRLMLKRLGKQKPLNSPAGGNDELHKFLNLEAGTPHAKASDLARLQCERRK
jgi:putative transposase